LVPSVEQKKTFGISEKLMNLDDRDLQPEAYCRESDRARRKMNEKDRVAFLMYRAPVTSWPCDKMLNLESSMPIELARMMPMHRTQFCWSNHDEVERDTRFVRKRDRVTEYTEARLLLANILRKA